MSAELCSWNFVKAINRRLALNIKAFYKNGDDMSLTSDFLRNSGFVSYEEFISRPPYFVNQVISAQTISKKVRERDSRDFGEGWERTFFKNCIIPTQWKASGNSEGVGPQKPKILKQRTKPKG